MSCTSWKYVKFELLIFNETVRYDNENFLIPNTDNYGNNTETRVTNGSGIYHYKNFALTFTKGRQRVLFDKIVLDYWLRFGITPAGFAVGFINFGDGENTTSMWQDYRNRSLYRVFREQLVNFHIGIGFLAF